VVDHQVGLGERVDLSRVAAKLLHRIAHGRKIDDGRDAGKILHQDTRWLKGNLALACRSRRPFGKRLNILGCGKAIADIAQQRLKKNTNRKWKAGKIRANTLSKRIKAVDCVLTSADGKGRARAKWIIR
jgi:uncharacterized protein YjhX (UPF0386 family)